MTELVVGLIGHPVAHSRSPEIFAEWRQERQVTGRYELIDVPPAALAVALETAWDDGWHGLNVTIPHKQTALAFADSTSITRATGATNCLVRTESGWRADNTDGDGLIAALERDGAFLINDKRVVILGGGGAARAAAYALGQTCHVSVVSRLPVSLAGAVEWHPWTDPPLAGASLLINCTPIGMSGGPAADVGWEHLPWSDLPADALVFDMVYEPLMTPLLREAQRRGHPTLDGMSMLVRQGILSYERWLEAARL